MNIINSNDLLSKILENINNTNIDEDENQDRNIEEGKLNEEITTDNKTVKNDKNYSKFIVQNAYVFTILIFIIIQLIYCENKYGQQYFYIFAFLVSYILKNNSVYQLKKNE